MPQRPEPAVLESQLLQKLVVQALKTATIHVAINQLKTPQTPIVPNNTRDMVFEIRFGNANRQSIQIPKVTPYELQSRLNGSQMWQAEVQRTQLWTQVENIVDRELARLHSDPALSVLGVAQVYVGYVLAALLEDFCEVVTGYCEIGAGCETPEVGFEVYGFDGFPGLPSQRFPTLGN